METKSNSQQPQRAVSLDALRGYAILTMVLSAMVAGGVLPGWMYHAQTPPPTHAYQPDLAGLTWVDLVFPFFLFSMGAAFPFSLRRKAEKAERKDAKFWGNAAWQIFSRAVLLTFFAIFIQHSYPYMQAPTPGATEWLTAIGCFALLFAIYLRFPASWGLKGRWVTAIRAAGFAFAIAVLYIYDAASDHDFSFYTSNIIILLLANMAFFGSLAYYATMGSHWGRLWLLAALAGLFLSAGVEGSWTASFAQSTPLPWLYRFEYLKYLFIVLAGSAAGDMLYDSLKQKSAVSHADANRDWKAWALAWGSFLVVVVCLTGLYCRWSLATFLAECVLAAAIIFISRLASNAESALWRQLALYGAALLLVGLCFEPFEGGIKKDGPTFSYLIATSGLACYALLFFNIICDYLGHRRATKFLWSNGQNPMIAYVAADLLILPLLSLLGITKYLYVFHANAWLGLLQGILLTSAAMLVTMLCTDRKLFWRS